MKPERVPIKGPVGKDEEGNLDGFMPEAQERYEEEGGRSRDIVTDVPGLDPFRMMAPETDHTPNFTHNEKQSKPEYGKFEGRGNGGVGL